MISERVGSEFLELIAERVAAKLLPEVMERISSIPPQKPDVTMDATEAAAYIGISKELLYQMCSEGSIPHLRLGSDGTKKKRIIFSSNTIDNWRKEQEQLNFTMRKGR